MKDAGKSGKQTGKRKTASVKARLELAEKRRLSGRPCASPRRPTSHSAQGQPRRPARGAGATGPLARLPVAALAPPRAPPPRRRPIRLGGGGGRCRLCARPPCGLIESYIKKPSSERARKGRARRRREEKPAPPARLPCPACAAKQQPAPGPGQGEGSAGRSCALSLPAARKASAAPGAGIGRPSGACPDPEEKRAGLRGSLAGLRGRLGRGWGAGGVACAAARGIGIALISILLVILLKSGGRANEFGGYLGARCIVRGFLCVLVLGDRILPRLLLLQFIGTRKSGNWLSGSKSSDVMHPAVLPLRTRQQHSIVETWKP
ncbi:Hypothetical predicted protein [Podarcis lilfordi]|uniref:Uncharacterized protein n=1 Tax=Podarcis lilfordi TaxID=74358 RepID=A0AA35K6Z8_9SAUR|nr:Hypothetical predicted protein [Podarcis lilfordi]